jgi:hypothetical protein
MYTLSSLVHGLPPVVGRERLLRALMSVSVVAVLLFAGTARAGVEEPLPDRFMLRLGGYNIKSANTVMRLDSANYPVGAYIDFKETLGGETRASLFRMDALYRFNDHHGLGLSWYDIRFTGSRVLEKDITWGDQTYLANYRVDSNLEFNVYKLNYQYSLLHNEEAELGASFGLHIMRVSAGLSGTNSSGTSQAMSEAVTAPLPVFGLYADYNFTPRFSIFYNYQFFFVSYEDKFRGGLQDFIFGLEYRLFRHVALGAAYNRFAINATIKQDVSTLYLNSNWNGGMLYASVYF